MEGVEERYLEACVYITEWRNRISNCNKLLWTVGHSYVAFSSLTGSNMKAGTIYKIYANNLIFVRFMTLTSLMHWWLINFRLCWLELRSTFPMEFAHFERWRRGWTEVTTVHLLTAINSHVSAFHTLILHKFPRIQHVRLFGKKMAIIAQFD